MRRYLRRCGINKRQFEDWAACSVEEWIALNPRWPLYALVGVLLEFASERDAAIKIIRDKLTGK